MTKEEAISWLEQPGIKATFNSMYDRHTAEAIQTLLKAAKKQEIVTEGDISENKKYGSVEINLKNGQLFQNGNEIKCPSDIHQAFMRLMIYENLKDNYTNPEDELWKLASLTVEYKDKYNLSEKDALEEAKASLGIELDNVDIGI